MLIFTIASVSTCAIILTSVKLVVEKCYECKTLETSHDHDDINITREIEQQKSKMKKIEELTGNSPIKQIDWIIDNSLNKFHELCASVMDGTYQDRKVELTIYQDSIFIENTEDAELRRHLSSRDYRIYSSAVMTEIRGGLGNRDVTDKWIEQLRRFS